MFEIDKTHAKAFFHINRLSPTLPIVLTGCIDAGPGGESQGLH